MCYVNNNLSNYDKNNVDSPTIADCNSPGVKEGTLNKNSKNTPNTEGLTAVTEGHLSTIFPNRAGSWNAQMALYNGKNPCVFLRGSDTEWAKWLALATKSDLVTRTAIALTAANSYSFNAEYTYGYKRAGWVEFQFNLESAFDRSKNNVLHIPDDCAADKQIWFPVFSPSGGNTIARGMVFHTDVHIIGPDAINGAKGLFGHVVYMSKS